jgi:23S rRNA (adenine2503-C2)-methyltransferase
VNKGAVMQTAETTAAVEAAQGRAKHVTDALAWLETWRGGRGEGEEWPLEQERLDLKEFGRNELVELMQAGFGEKKFRGQQVFSWLYQRLATDVADMSDLSKAFRERLSKLCAVSALELVGKYPAKDGTTKLAFKCRDGSVVETVYIPSQGRNTLCISSQVGCAMGCTFCWTAKMGLHRNLTVSEIVDQVVWARRLMGEQNGHIGNVVFMGMGEPLHNYENVVRAIRILTDADGLDFSRRKVTVSTSGLVPALERFGREVDVCLAVSLNGTTNEQRSSIMPVNDRWSIEELMACLRAYPLEKRERITLEYVLIRDLNDTLDDARRLVKLVRGLPSKINLIPFNPHPHTPFQAPDEATIDRFQAYLVEHNVSCFRRRTRGQDEMAACGQLGKPGEKEPPHVRKRLDKFRAKAAARAAEATAK